MDGISVGTIVIKKVIDNSRTISRNKCLTTYRGTRLSSLTTHYNDRGRVQPPAPQVSEIITHRFDVEFHSASGRTIGRPPLGFGSRHLRKFVSLCEWKKILGDSTQCSALICQKMLLMITLGSRVPAKRQRGYRPRTKSLEFPTGVLLEEIIGRITSDL